MTPEPLMVRVRSRYVRSAPRKARLVMEHIRGKPVEEARAILAHTPRAASRDVLKLLNSAVANAESNHELAPGELRVTQAYVDEGPTIKRYRPRALGRATRINKRTSHMTIALAPADAAGSRGARRRRAPEQGDAGDGGKPGGAEGGESRRTKGGGRKDRTGGGEE